MLNNLKSLSLDKEDDRYPVPVSMCLDLINDDVVLITALNELAIGVKRISELVEMSEYMKRKILDDNFHGIN